MILKSVEFYQSVRLWNNNETKTLDHKSKIAGLEINLEDHIVSLSCEDFDDIILVPTANLRHGRVENPKKYIVPDGAIDLSKIKTMAGKIEAVAAINEDPHPMENLSTPKKKKVK